LPEVFLYAKPLRAGDFSRKMTGFGDPERMRRAFIRAFGQLRNRCGGPRGAGDRPLLVA
jgi:hypothetical protein